MRRRSILGSLLAAPFVRLPKPDPKWVGGIDHGIGVDSTQTITMRTSPKVLITMTPMAGGSHTVGEYTIRNAFGETVRIDFSRGPVTLERLGDGYVVST
jgi:hypothetical protein